MKYLFTNVLCSIFLFTISLDARGQTLKKYDIKSGIITYENTISILGKAAPQKQIFYFDEYGMKECKELYEGDTLMETFLNDGKNLYTVVYEEKAAYHAGPAQKGTEGRFDWNAISDADKKNGKAKKLDSMTIAGKKCDAYEYTEGESKTVLAGWGHIILFADGKSNGMYSTSKAVKIQENVKITSEKFRVPTGFVIKKQ